MKGDLIFSGGLPYPPSVNHLWKYWSHGVYMTAEGKAYKNAVLVHLKKLYRGKPCLDEVALEIAVSYPDRRRRDLDNLLKITQDSLVFAGLLKDDRQIKDLRIYYAGQVQGGRLDISLYNWKLEEAGNEN